MANSTQNSFKNAIVTYLCNDKFLFGALALRQSISRNSPLTLNQVDLVCICLEDVSFASRKVLNEYGFRTIVYSKSEYIYSKRTDFLDRYSEKSWMTFTKLKIFSLIQYQKILYIDADAFVRRDISDLFEIASPFAAYNDQTALNFDNRGLNSGVMLISPSLESFESILANVDKKFAGGHTDQSLLQALFPIYYRLSKSYNTLYKANSRLSFSKSCAEYFESHIYHFNGPKPWLTGWNKTISLPFLEYLTLLITLHRLPILVFLKLCKIIGINLLSSLFHGLIFYPKVLIAKL